MTKNLKCLGCGNKIKNMLVGNKIALERAKDQKFTIAIKVL